MMMMMMKCSLSLLLGDSQIIDTEKGRGKTPVMGKATESLCDNIMVKYYSCCIILYFIFYDYCYCYDYYYYLLLLFIITIIIVLCIIIHI